MSHTPFAQEFKNLRLAAKLTQDAAGKRFGVGVRMIAYWESNQHLPPESEQESIIRTLREPATPATKQPPNLQSKPAIVDQPAMSEPAKPATVTPEPATHWDATRKGITDTPRAIAAAAEWAKRSNIYPPNSLPYGLAPQELLDAHARGEPSITITQRRHAQQWLEILA